MKIYVKSVSSNMENNSNIKFDDYAEFIYQNTHMSRESAREYAIDLWNKGVDKYRALAIINAIE